MCSKGCEKMFLAFLIGPYNLLLTFLAWAKHSRLSEFTIAPLTLFGSFLP